MQVKILEIRDHATYYAVVAVDMNPKQDDIEVDRAQKVVDQVRERVDRYYAQRYHLRRRGFPCDGRPNIAIFRVNSGGEPCWNDPYGWGDARFCAAHNHIIDHWAALKDGDVIDIAFILGETKTKKVSERLSDPL